MTIELVSGAYCFVASPPSLYKVVSPLVIASPRKPNLLLINPTSAFSWRNIHLIVRASELAFGCDG